MTTMTTIDRRTRFAGSALVMEADQLFSDLAERLARHRNACRARSRAPRPAAADLRDRRQRRAPRVADGALTLREGRADDGPVIGLDASAVLRAVPGRGVDVRAGHAAAGCRCYVPGVTSSWPGNRRCAPRSTGVRCTSRVDRVPGPQWRRARAAPVLPRRRRPRGHRPLPRRGGLPAPRRGVHRIGDGRGVSRARRGDGRGDAGRRRVVVGPDGGGLVSVTDPGVQPQVADLAGAARVRPVHSHRHVHRRCDGATAAARR